MRGESRWSFSLPWPTAQLVNWNLDNHKLWKPLEKKNIVDHCSMISSSAFLGSYRHCSVNPSRCSNRLQDKGTRRCSGFKQKHLLPRGIRLWGDWFERCLSAANTGTGAKAKRNSERRRIEETFFIRTTSLYIILEPHTHVFITTVNPFRRLSYASSLKNKQRSPFGVK